MGARHVVLFVLGLSLLVGGLVVVPSTPAHGRAMFGETIVATSPHDAVQPDARRRPRPRVVPPGPASPTSPVIDSYYYLLQHGKCADLRLRTDSSSNAEDVLFSALADLCLASRSTSYRADWGGAQVALDASTALDDCLSVAARTSLSNALANRAKTGRQRPDFRPTPKVSTCLPQVTYVGIYQRSTDAAPTLLLLGHRLFEASEVKVADTWLPGASRNAVEGTECARVDVPGWAPPQPGSTITVAVRGRGYTTATIAAVVGGALTDDDIANVDTDACLPS